MAGKIPLVLDTCALRDWDFIRWLGSYHCKKIISPIVYAEFSAQMLRQRMDQPKIRKLLHEAGIEITLFNAENAQSAALFMAEAGDKYYCSACGSTNWNDCLIAAHAPYPPYVLVTNNTKDFYSLLGENRVRTPNEIMYPGRTG